MSDEFDRQALSAMIDYWISPAAVKREFEATKSKCLNLPPFKPKAQGSAIHCRNCMSSE